METLVAIHARRLGMTSTAYRVAVIEWRRRGFDVAAALEPLEGPE